MVNDFLYELYLKVSVLHLVWLLAAHRTIDRFQVSIVMAFKVADCREPVILIGRPVAALQRWLDEAHIRSGSVFRRIDQWENIDRRALTPQPVNLILKSRCKQGGLDPTLFSAHELRPGYLTEAANRGIPLPETMQQSLHKSVTQAALLQQR